MYLVSCNNIQCHILKKQIKSLAEFESPDKHLTALSEKKWKPLIFAYSFQEP